MSIKLTFLSAAIPLTKTFELTPENVLVKHSYPRVKHFTSHEVTIKNLLDLYNTLVIRAVSPEKPCMLKGELAHPLVNEARAQMTSPDTPTRFVTLDLDKAPFSTSNEFMKAVGLGDISYIWQYSSSAKVNPEDKTLSGHIFLILEKPMHPHAIRAWLMWLNLRTDILKQHITLSNSKAALHWPLDIVVNDNGRLIYIAEPVFKGMKSPIPSTERITYVNKALDLLPAARMNQHNIEALKKEARDHMNSLRAKESILPLKSKLKMVGEWEIQPNVGEASSYQVIDDGSNDYIRYNLNGGDSQAYWHPRGNFEYLHNFKGEPSVLMKEILPQRYAELTRVSKAVNSTPNKAGDLLLAFRDKHTADYWKGIWNEEKMLLDIHKVKSELQLDHFLQSHGSNLGAFIPEWRMFFNPHEPEIVNEDEHTINLFVPPELMRENRKRTTTRQTFPTIQRVIDHAVGIGPIQDHFINWLSVIIKTRNKTGTAWILHGTEGTGKGVIINRVLKPILTKYLVIKKASELKSEFTGWMETALLVFVDEVEADAFERKSMEGDLRNAITEPSFSIRRMRTDSYEVDSYVNFIFSSNKPQPVRIPIGDRRFNVGTYQPSKLIISTHELYQVIPRELETFADYLMNYACDVDLAATILQTEDRAAIQSLSLTSLDEFAHSITSGDLAKLWEYMPDERFMAEHGLINVAASGYAALLKRFYYDINDESRISRDELHIMFEHAIGKMEHGANKFTAFLRHHGIVTKKIWAGTQSSMGIQVKWKTRPEWTPVTVTEKLRKVK